MCVLAWGSTVGKAIIGFRCYICSVMLPGSSRSDGVWRSASHLNSCHTWWPWLAGCLRTASPACVVYHANMLVWLLSVTVNKATWQQKHIKIDCSFLQLIFFLYIHNWLKSKLLFISGITSGMWKCFSYTKKCGLDLVNILPMSPCCFTVINTTWLEEEWVSIFRASSGSWFLSALISPGLTS